MSISTPFAGSAPAAPTVIATGAYEIDPVHSRLGFVARYAMVTKVRGAFTDFDGSGWFDAGDPPRSHLELTIRAGSVDTRNAERDEHLRSDDFLDVDRYPTLGFRSTEFEQLDDTVYRVRGDLTIKDVTKRVTIDFEVSGSAVDPDGVDRIGFEGTTVINRKDWGVNFNATLDAGGLLVGDHVTLELDVSAIRAANG